MCYGPVRYLWGEAAPVTKINTGQGHTNLIAGTMLHSESVAVVTSPLPSICILLGQPLRFCPDRWQALWDKALSFLCLLNPLCTPRAGFSSLPAPTWQLSSRANGVFGTYTQAVLSSPLRCGWGSVPAQTGQRSRLFTFYVLPIPKLGLARNLCWRVLGSEGFS